MPSAVACSHYRNLNLNIHDRDRKVSTTRAWTTERMHTMLLTVNVQRTTKSVLKSKPITLHTFTPGLSTATAGTVDTAHAASDLHNLGFQKDNLAKSKGSSADVTGKEEEAQLARGH